MTSQLHRLLQKATYCCCCLFSQTTLTTLSIKPLTYFWASANSPCFHSCCIYLLEIVQWEENFVMITALKYSDLSQACQWMPRMVCINKNCIEYQDIGHTFFQYWTPLWWILTTIIIIKISMLMICKDHQHWNCFNLQFTYRSTIYGLIRDPHKDQLPVGLITQLVEHCTHFAKVRVWVPFRPFFYYCSSGIA